MANRYTLHKSHLPEFKQWLVENGIGYRDGKGTFQVLQVLTPKDGWQCLYDKIEAPEHYTVQDKLMPTVQAFIRSRKKAADTIEQQAARIANIEADLSQALNERDAAEERGTSLAEAVGEHFRVEVGEHSSMNDPLAMAIAILEGEYITDSDTDRKLSAANALIERNKATFKRICEVKFSNWSDEWMRNRANDQATAIERYQKGEQG